MASYSGIRKDDLQAEVARRREAGRTIDVADDASRDDLAAALRADDEAREREQGQAGDQPQQGDIQQVDAANVTVTEGDVVPQTSSGGSAAGHVSTADGQAVAGPDGDRVRDVLAAHAHGDIPPATGQQRGDSPAVAGLADDDPRRQAQAGPREGLGQAEAANAEVQDRMDAATEQGYRGLNPDPTPNEAYTVSGVLASAPTPETDPGVYAAARDNLVPGGGRFGPEAVEGERARRDRDSDRTQDERDADDDR